LTILDDYYNFLGEYIPYQKLRLNTLLEFIQSTDVFRIENLRGNIMVYVENNRKPQHLAEMIKKQKATKMV